MIEIDKTLVSESLFEKHFVCDLKACKGACCVEGDEGAPLVQEEVEYLRENIDTIKPYLRNEGVEAIEEQGSSKLDKDGDQVTPLINGAECAYVVFDENKTAKCGIELAHNDGAISFKKPISCHLYPIRVAKLKEVDALNYHFWPICNAACDLGENLKVKVYEFLKEPLIRQYGEEFYDTLKEVDVALDNMKKSP